jgi:hypothetical protein
VSLIGLLLLLLFGLVAGTNSGSSSSSGSATAVAKGTAVVICQASQLHASLLLQGAAGSREGVLVIRNRGPRCAVAGPLRFHVVAKKQAPLKQHGAPPLQSISVPRGAAVDAPLRWSNWCGGAVKGLSIHLPVVNQKLFAAYTEAPPCNGPGFPSTIETKAFTHRK